MTRAEAVRALDKIDEARGFMRDARNKSAEAEATINLELAKLYAWFSVTEDKR